MNLLAQSTIGETFLGTGSHPLNQLTGPSALISILLSNSIVIAGVILLFIFIFAGYSYIGAGGNPQKVQAATKYLTYGVAGFLLVFATFFIIRIIESITGVSILQ